MSLYEALGGGARFGVTHPPPRGVTDEDVRDIREMYRERVMNQVELAEHFGISQSNVSRIINRKRRKDVT